MKLFLTVILAAAFVVPFIGCASHSTPAPDPTPSNASAVIESALPLVRTGAAVATGAVLDFAVNQSSTRTRVANEMYSSASAIYTLTGGSLPSVSQFTATVTAWGVPGDAQYAQYTQALSAIYQAYYSKLVASGNLKTATDLLNAIAGGIEDATQSYVTVAPAAS